MKFSTPRAGLASRVLSAFAMIMGLGFVDHMLGFGNLAHNPVLQMGAQGLIISVTICLLMIFSSLGLWMRELWGAGLFSSLLALELVAFLGGSYAFSLSMPAFLFKMLTLILTVTLIFLSRESVRARN